MTPCPTPVPTPLRGLRPVFTGLAPLALALVAGSVGCYRATGQSRPTTVAQQIPATGGDRIAGMKATAGPGDYYLGNDYIQMAVDGAAYGREMGQFGAPSGGAILDIGGVALDTAYNRVSLPTDNLESLAPVVNQDPDLRLVFDRYSTVNTSNLVTLTMQGYLLDPLHKLAGATWASDGRVQGVAVTHTISLGSHDSFFTLGTTLSNNSGTALPIQSLGDYLHQRGGGFRFVIPANQDRNGNPLSTWGLDIPGSDFTQPLATSVRASMVALQGAEPSADDLDSHQSMGLLPLDQDQVLVASDPQTTLNEDRPIFPARLVVGQVPGAATIPVGGTLSYNRRLYALSGVSLSSGYPVGPDGVSNEMEAARSTLRGFSAGTVVFSAGSTAAIRGYRQTEIRFERFVGNPVLNPPATDTNPADWSLERITCPEAGEVPAPPLGGLINLPAYPDPSAPAGAQPYLPYRVLVRNKSAQTINQTLFHLDASTNAITNTLLRPSPTAAQTIVTPLYAEMGTFQSPDGDTLSPTLSTQLFTLRTQGQIGVTNAYQPARFTFGGLDGSGNLNPAFDPDFRRNRYMAGFFNPITKSKVAPGSAPGDYVFSGGNGFFGSSFIPNAYAIPLSLPLGSYALYASQGPLNPLSTQQVLADTSTQGSLVGLTFRLQPRPAGGWAAFDVPGPSQRTTGGMLPAEQLSSALAEGVDVVGRTETDEFTDGAALYASFRSEFTNSGNAATDAAHLGVIGNDPVVVNARSSSLAEGSFTALFSPTPSPSLPFGGALPSSGWSAADFIGQSGGSFVIANRPRGPQGLFTAHPVVAGTALGTGGNSWWDNTDALANGHRIGDFDAIELLRGEGCNPADPSAWFTEFKSVRTDWFNLLNLETPVKFTKGLGLSSGVYSLDTPVGLARTYLKLGGAGVYQPDLSPVAAALSSGAAVASTGPLVDAAIGATGPGGLVGGPIASVQLTVNLWAATWVPIDEVRVVVNGAVAATAAFGTNPAAGGWTADPADARHWSQTFNLPMSGLTGGKDGWVVVEAGVPLSTTGAYAVGTPWNKVMKGIYPVAVTNPIFVDVNGGGYTAPLP